MLYYFEVVERVSALDVCLKDANNRFYSVFCLWQVDLRHMDEKAGSNVVEVGVDLSEFYMSVEWDILEVPAVR